MRKLAESIAKSCSEINLKGNANSKPGEPVIIRVGCEEVDILLTFC